jgi:hypothetical protein
MRLNPSNKFLRSPVDPFDFDANTGGGKTTEVKDDKQKKQDPPKEEKKKDDQSQDEDEKQKPGTDFDLILEDDDQDDGQDEEDDKSKDDKSKDNKSKDDKSKDDKSKDDDKNDKDTSNKVLRQQRDEARNIAKKYGNLDPDVAVAMNEYITARFGDQIPSAEEIRGEFLLLADKDKEIDRYKTQVEDQSKAIRELDIRMSPEFKSDFIDPYNSAVTNLQVEFVNLDGDGKVLAPQASASFQKWLLDNKSKMDAMQMKAALSQFSKAFKQEAGMDYQPPAINTMMTAIGAVNSKSDKMNQAYENWETQKKESTTKAQQEREQSRAKEIEAAKRVRKQKATEAMSSYDYQKLIELGVIEDKSEYTKIFSREFQATESIFANPESAPTYDELIVRNFKAGHYDALLEKYEKLKKFKDDYDAESKGESKGGGGDTDDDDEDDNWHGGKLK